MASVSTVVKLNGIKKKLGIETWTEVLFAGLTVYSALAFVLSATTGITLAFSGILGVVGLGFAWFYIRIAGSLNEKLKSFEKENLRFQEENRKLQTHLNSFKEQNAKLKTVSDSLAKENTSFKTHLSTLEKSLDDLESVKEMIEEYGAQNKQDLGDIINSVKDTLDEQKKVLKGEQEVLARQVQNTHSQEELLLHQLQSQVQFLDQTAGLSEKEFSTFKSMLPDKFKRSTVAGKAFAAIDSDADGVISVMEFQKLVHDIVEEISDENGMKEG
eukprot:TRINITY_DN6068_c0_g1_i1.p1 TRINITY_DN6068_c0_g1~~TRINITY_DN6068_c0_g1_i1.p1  ORF type:complete len:272 (+),score=57.76 TRINITY_DN6068_c0_g1_i1:101-916(+)